MVSTPYVCVTTDEHYRDSSHDFNVQTNRGLSEKDRCECGGDVEESEADQ